MIDQE
jgi:hypothetical protein